MPANRRDIAPPKQAGSKGKTSCRALSTPRLAPISVVLGMGEVGRALANVLSSEYQIVGKDIEPAELPERCMVLHVCLRYGPTWLKTVLDVASHCRPTIIDVCSTVPPGTTETLGGNACHSTTRGLHPNLEGSTMAFVKHIGGPRAWMLAEYYAKAGVATVKHAKAKTTELAHILSNTLYGVNIMYADEMYGLCRKYGVDYNEAVTHYTMTSNEGYAKLGYSSKMRFVLIPPNGKIGGHCVAHGARLIPADMRGPMLESLARMA